MTGRLGSLQGVESASLSWYPPISGDLDHWTQSIAVDGAPAQPVGENVYFNAVSPEYFRTLGIRLLRAAFGIAIALPAAAVLGRFARRFLFQITPLDPVALLGSSVLMLALAACAGLIPACRAARLDPAIALRTE